MSRQLEKDLEDRAAKKRIKLAHAIDYGLADAVRNAGFGYDGFAYKNNDVDALVVLKVHGSEGKMVAFVGGGSLSDCIIKAEAEVRRDKLQWRADKWDEKQT